MDQSRITVTSTVRRAQSELTGPINAAEIVKKIIEYHREYAEGSAREVHDAEWPSFEQEESKPAEEWIEQLTAMFDPLLTDQLHGQLAILGLCHLDKTLGKHLKGFTTEIRKDLLEDFESLLLPEFAGKERYRRDFLRILQNRAKLEPDIDFNQRHNGFVILTKGGTKLDALAGLCFQQDYNSCLSARYQVFGESGLRDFSQFLMTDLRGLAAKDYATIGTYLPEPGGTQRPGGQQVPGSPPKRRPNRSWVNQVSLMNTDTIPEVSDTSPESALRYLGDYGSEALDTGQRLVFLVEWRGLDKEASADSIGLTDSIVDAFHSLPERMGIVISGLPDDIRSSLISEPVYKLELPEESAPRRSQKLENDTPTGPDRLNIQDDVEALADAIALKDMSPPMVVGIFGGWGAGKSFVLHLIEQRLQERRCEGIGNGEEALQNYPFVGHPYLVHFDAWTYAKGNLWASLMQTTLVELDRQISLERILARDLNVDWRSASKIWKSLWQLSEKQRHIFTKTELGKKALLAAQEFSQSGSPGTLWQELESLRDDEYTKLRSENEKLRDLREDQRRARRLLEQEVDGELSAEAQKMAWLPVWEELGKLVKGNSGKPDALSFDEMVSRISLPKKFWLGITNLSFPAVMFMVVALVGGLVVAKLGIFDEVYSQVSGAVIALTAPVLRAWEWFESRRSAYEDRITVILESKDKLRQERIDERVKLAADNSAGKSVADLGEKIANREATINSIRSRIGITGHARSLNEFLKTRIEAGTYQKELGLLDQIQNDIQELSDTLLPSRARGVIDRKKTDELFPRGDPRVVLFIDDLDRCPPDKVVEVLEAAQLLVKTQLFVVVIALDVRYVTRALENEYKGVLIRSGEPSGLDYIEKIIQIPYRVRPVSAKGADRFLSSQMEIIETEKSQQEEQTGTDETALESADNADQLAEKAILSVSAQSALVESIALPTQAVQFESEEYAAISASCKVFPVSPRTMKRLVNVFKLLKIIWYRQGLDSGPMPDVKQAMVSILALCASFPEVLRTLLSKMDAFYRDESKKLDQNLVEFLEQCCEEGKENALYPPDWEQVAKAIKDKSFFPEKLSFGLLKEANLHLLISFSFVGETDSEREATLQRGFYRNRVTDTPNKTTKKTKST